MKSSLSKDATGANIHNYDLQMSDLRKLFNSKVYMADRMIRPLSGLPFQIGDMSHSGVRVTLQGGKQWLVHKGDGYGLNSQTVVVDAHHMSDKWKVTETKNFGGSKTVSNFVEVGGTEYDFWTDNCHHASTNMIRQ